MQNSIKQHNTFTTIAAAKVEVIATYTDKQSLLSLLLHLALQTEMF